MEEVSFSHSLCLVPNRVEPDFRSRALFLMPNLSPRHDRAYPWIEEVAFVLMLKRRPFIFATSQ
jgi:hypothetical protein